VNAVLRRSVASVRETLLLENATRTAASYPEGARARMRELVRAARARAVLADQSLESHVIGAVTLYREAALLYLASLVTVRGPEPLAEPLRADDVLARARPLLDAATAPCAAAEVDAFLDSLRGADPMAIDRLAPPEAEARGRTAYAIVKWLSTLIELRDARALKFDRNVRLAAAGLVALGALTWALAGLTTAANVALHKPVTTSGVHPNAVSPPSGLTDGVTTGAPYGVHTKSGDAPWVQVDLLGVFAIDKIKIYNRGDGWFDDGLPFTLRLSEDGVAFKDVDVRTTSFKQDAPWVATGHNWVGRYVRIQGARGKYVTLSELEVFGRSR
jgi:F5/8 type C domain